MWRAARAVVGWGVAGALTALPGCTPYAQGYAYTTHQTFSTAASPAAAQPVPSPTPALSAASSTNPPSETHSELSDQVTYYLQGHRLPLVGAQVTNAAAGNHKVILYGFVATEHGKNDAEDKARQFLNEPNAEIDNRIAVRPELRTPNSPLSAAASSFPTAGASSASPGAASAPPQTLPPARLNELLGALLLGMAIVSTLPTATGPGTAMPPGSAPSPVPSPSVSPSP